ncbi:hypothetical protein sos41_32230 [Alphaproteobacteria bacterium SO-S41]|nr:hypothetical protein sos41_32230 [Alphaproteobacteria bacterium SO-S41]
MTRAIYTITHDARGYLVVFEDRPYGPYAELLDAFKTAAHSAFDAAKQNADGAEVFVQEDGGRRTIWASEVDSYPMDFRARLGLPPLF